MSDQENIKLENQPQAIKYQIEQSYTVSDYDVFCLRFSSDDQLIASGNYEGCVEIYDLRKKQMLHKLQTSQDDTPVTSLRWRPNRFYKAKKVLMVGNSDGSVSHWHAQSGKQLFKLIEQDNQVLACDYQYDGRSFCTAGQDFRVRIYDENTKQVISKMEPNSWNNMGHSNRIFSVKFTDENTIISGGWDSNIHIWDARTQKSVAHIYGPSISGDSVDYKDNIILTGQYRNKEQVQSWDIRTLQQVNSFGDKNDNVYVYSTQFSKYSSSLTFGSSGQNTVQILNQDFKLNTKITGLTKGCYSLDYANNSERFVFYGGQNKCYIISN